jgi:hypothetical protein
MSRTGRRERRYDGHTCGFLQGMEGGATQVMGGLWHLSVQLAGVLFCCVSFLSWKIGSGAVDWVIGNILPRCGFSSDGEAPVVPEPLLTSGGRLLVWTS